MGTGVTRPDINLFFYKFMKAAVDPNAPTAVAYRPIEKGTIIMRLNLAYRPIEKGTIVFFILIDTSFAGRFERPRNQE